ncbi:SDR family oxidoreductase [Frankia sp. AgB1.9]|uniref:SDR family NAD(P)-dependent oxidoreductase n=1 Tax=unclassified Frankia TaxID=2632575 RepID=UPI001932F939|nr:MULTISPECIES: SDR family oxidoreductase [unclassified Frankia]MBL7488236.1 SDR family oxidoreductase [Frankia sp. AgW1.1]MBL7548121.1 SDR family oxidoreductase [Frankia sp. AgB1.9]MBL7620347.1 SDR family oxidoreductase [Frankia sp. AgB1.8]
MTDGVRPAGPLAGRVALVTGAAQAAGRGYARALAAAGAHVVVADQFPDAGQETVGLIEKDGGVARFFLLDVTDEASARAAVAFAVETFGRLDVLVNNPNRYRDTKYTALAELSVEHWDTTMAVMVRGTFLLCKAAVPELAKSPAPAIVNHTSSAAYGVRNWLDYGTARGAVIAMTKSLAKELAPLGIRVNALSVGSMAAEAISLGVLEREEQMTGTPEFGLQLIQRVATEDDVAGPVVFLASEASRYMTGQTISYDGGKFFLG